MRPILFMVGGLELRSYSLILFLATLIGLWLLAWRVRRLGLPAIYAGTFGAGAVLCGLLGARLADVAAHWPAYSAQDGGLWRAVLYGGMTASGGIIGMLAWTVIFARRVRWRASDWLETLAPVIPVVEGIARWGCLLNGCCYGKETDSLPGLYLPDDSGLWAVRYPTQIAYSLSALTIAGVLGWLARQRWAAGRLFPAFLMLYGADYFLLDFWRADVTAAWGGLSIRQWAAVVALVVGLAAWFWAGPQLADRVSPQVPAHIRVTTDRARWWLGGVAALLTLTVLGCGYRSIAIEAHDNGSVTVRTRFEVHTEDTEPPDCTADTDQNDAGVKGADTESCQPFTDTGSLSAGCDCMFTYRRVEDFNARFRITTSSDDAQVIALVAQLNKHSAGYRLTASIKPAELWVTSYEVEGARRWAGPMTFSVHMPGRITGHTEPRSGKLERVSVDGREIRWQFRGAEENDGPAETYTLTVDSERSSLALGWQLPIAGLLAAAVAGGAAWWITERGRASRRALVDHGRVSPPPPVSVSPGQTYRSAPTQQQAGPGTPVTVPSRAGPVTGYPEIGQTLGRYVLRELIGRGGMAAVYRARHTVLGRNVALKVLAPHLTGSNDFVRRFQREGQLLAGLVHPNIVIVYDAGYDGGYYYLAMEYIEGESLDRRLARKHSLPPAEVIWIGCSVTAALAYAHAQGIIHRDIKPANVLLTRDRRLKVADFGIAALVGQGVTLMAGTPGYMPPEGAQGTADVRGDIFSTGALLYHLVTGQSPAPVTGRAPMSAEQLVAGLPPALAEIVSQALQPNPGHRFQSAVEMQRALERARATIR